MINNNAFLALLNRSIMLSIGERRELFNKEKLKELSTIYSSGIGPGSGAIAGRIGELCIKEFPIRTNIILRTLERVVIDSGLQPFPGLPEILKREALKFIPTLLGEFRTIIDNLHINMVKSNQFEPEFLSAKLNAENKINTEIDLLLLRLYSSLKDKNISIGTQTIYNIQSQGGIVQTGNSSKAALVLISSAEREQLITSLNFILKSIIEAHDFEISKKEETKDVIEELKIEIEKQKPNGMKVSSLLIGLATAIQTIASIKPAYDSLKAVALYFGVPLP